MAGDTAKKILVVDDDKALVEMVRLKLISEGYKVLTAFNGAEAISTAKAHHPDLVILDLLMPKMNGAQMEKALRNCEGTKDIPIIFITGVIDKKQAVMVGNKLGKYLVIAKPFDAKELLAAIGKVLK